jgi:hypothetical protein
MPLYVQSEIRRIEQSTAPGEGRAQALTALGERLVQAMAATEDYSERHRLRVLHTHVMRRAADERETTP